MTRTVTGARQANEQHIGILIEYDEGPDLYVDAGPLYEAAVGGSFGQIKPMRVVSERQWPITSEDVNVERDRRLKLDFDFRGKMIQRDDVSLRRIQGAAQMATIAIVSGISPDSEDWVNGGPLVWITSDNTEIELTPIDTIAMGQAAAGIESRFVHAAKRLKQMNPIPLDFTDETWWE